MSERSVTTFCLVKALHGFPVDTGIFFYDHLAYAFSVIDYKRLVAKIYHYHANLSAIVGVDGTGSVDERYAVLQSQS